MQTADLLAELNTGNDSGAGGTQTSSEGDGVLDVHMSLDGEAALVVAAEDVESNTGDQVDLGIQADILLALALVRDAAVQRLVRSRLGAVDGDMELQVHGQGQANDVEAGANVGARARRLDDELFNLLGRGHCVWSESGLLLLGVEPSGNSFTERNEREMDEQSKQSSACLCQETQMLSFVRCVTFTEILLNFN